MKYEIPANLPLWSLNSLVVDKYRMFDGAPTVMQGKFKVTLPLGAEPNPEPQFLYVHNVGLLKFFSNSGRDLGFGPGLKSPKDLLQSWMDAMVKQSYVFQNIEEGRSKYLAMARVKFEYKGTGGGSGVMYVAMDPPDYLTVETRGFGKALPAELAILEASVLTIRR